MKFKPLILSMITVCFLFAGYAFADQYDAAYKGVLELDTQTAAPASGDWIERYDVSADEFVKVDAAAGKLTTLTVTGDTNLQQLLINDDDKLLFGASSDFHIKYNSAEAYLESGPNTLLWSTAPSRISSDPFTFYEISDDFLAAASATASDKNTWVSVDDGGTGTNAFQDAAGGVFNVVTAAAADDHHTMTSKDQVFLIADGKAIWCEARVKVNEAATNDSAWIFGLMDDVTTGGLQTGTSGPLSSYDGIVLWVDEGSLDVDFETSNAGTQATTTDIATSVTNTWTRVGFHCDGTATTTVCTPYVAVNDSSTLVAGTAQNVTTSGMQEMYMLFGLKSGGSVETLQVDYAVCKQLR